MDGPVTFEELASLMKGRAGLTVEPAELESRRGSTFEEFDLDSLGLLGIIAELGNRYGRTLSEEAEACKTPNDLLNVVNAELTQGA